MADLVVAVDAMGGDHAPAALVAGAAGAVRRGGVRVTLVGARPALEAALTAHRGVDAAALTVVDAPEVVAMDEAPLAALRRKPGASIRIAVDLVARGDAHAVFSAGHTGAALLAARGQLGLLPGVERPALAVTIPTRSGAAILLDAGASVDCRPDHLAQFGVMGAAYARVALGLARPNVGLLSIGPEAGKGNDLIREAHALLARAPIRFIGNLEARDLFTGRADVVVCDGFTGNVALKVGEGLVETIEALVLDATRAGELAGVGAVVEPVLSRLKQRVDYAQSGGAPLLGVAGVVVVGHGHSSPTAVENGILMASRLAGERIIDRLTKSLEE
jgi:glycerol-3-phosphate acyltransferase PlsX